MPKIWTPAEILDAVTIYIDETYLHRHSGVIKAAIAIHDAARPAFEAAMRPLLDLQGTDEFKAGKLKRRNRQVYRQFLRYITNVIAETGRQTSLRSVISIESRSVYSSPLFEAIKKALGENLRRYSVETKLVSDVAELIVWCVGHLQFLIPDGMPNPLAIIMDEKFRSDLKMVEQKWFNSPMLGFATPLSFHQLLPDIVNVVLAGLRVPVKSHIPTMNLIRIDCRRSDTSIYLQAADLFSNLMLNFLLYEKGARTPVIEMKHEMLSAVFHGGGPGPALMSSLEFRDQGDAGIKLVVMGNVVARTTLGPVI